MVEIRVIRKLFPLLLLFFLFSVSGLQVYAQERIYWEDPDFLKLENPRFPQFASSSGGLTVLSHEYEFSGEQRG